MRLTLPVALLVLSLTGSGCALIEDGAHNAYWCVKKPIEEHLEKARNRRWADDAWQQVCNSGAPGKPSEDYARGFKDGFAEFLFRGGDGEPPLMPPTRYRDIRYQNERGYSAVQDWFAGYRHGATLAHDSGARKWITGPSSLQAQLEAMEAHDHGPQGTGEPMPLPPPVELPPPQPLPMEELPPPPQPKVLPRDPGVDDLPPLPEPVRLRIRKISEVRQTGVEPTIINGNPDEPRARITNLRSSSTRPRIVGVHAAPASD